ncbi:MAG: aquaporin family protein [Actinomycetia bacterium]|nr:aquaporin family protein [Actinomycetes bacterium]
MQDWQKIVVGEFLGTFTLTFFGCSVIATAVLAGAQVGLWQVAVVWGIAVALGIYLAADLSGAHLNPAVTVALALWRKSADLKETAIYIGSQLGGAITAGLLVYLVFGQAIGKFEAGLGLVRGQPGSQLSAMMFGEYFPNPGLSDEAAKIFSGIGPAQAFLGEAIGTAFLVMVIFTVTKIEVPMWLQPILIGAAIALIISTIAPLTQAGFNPARDFGPRLVSFFAGWGRIAIPGPHNGFWIYIAGPITGGIVGGWLVDRVAGKRHHRKLEN